MCRIQERVLENQLKINQREIETFEQKLLGLYSKLHKMKATQAQLQQQLYEESRERLTIVVKPRVPRPLRIPKTITLIDAFAKLGWTSEAIANALKANPRWKEKEVRI